MRTLGLVLLLYTLFVALPATASSPYTYVFDGVSYPNLQTAEAAMRAANPDWGQYLKQCQVIKNSGSTEYQYCSETAGIYFASGYAEDNPYAGHRCPLVPGTELRLCSTFAEAIEVTKSVYYDDESRCFVGTDDYAPPAYGYTFHGQNLEVNGVYRGFAVWDKGNETATLKGVFCGTEEPYDQPETSAHWTYYECPTGTSPDYSGNRTPDNVCVGGTAEIVKQDFEAAVSCPRTGYPCVPSTGAKLLTEVDFEWGAHKFTRFYNSLLNTPDTTGIGLTWSHVWSDRLEIDGGKYTWRNARNDVQVFHDWTYQFRAENPNLLLERLPDGTFQLLADGVVRHFNAQGRLISIVQNGRIEDSLTFTYDGNLISRVTDVRGRELQFQYENGQIKSISSAGTALATYAFDQGKRLVSATYADGKSRQYHYGEANHLCIGGGSCDPGYFPNHLTGVTDETGQRLLDASYDETGRVVTSIQAGGANETVLTYPALGSAEVTQAGHGTSLYEFDESVYRRPLSRQLKDGNTVVGTDTWSYDTGGFRHDGPNGYATITYLTSTVEVTPPGLEKRKIEAANASYSAPEMRITETTWTTDASPMPATVTIENAQTVPVLQVAYAYNARRQVETVTLTDPATSTARITTAAYCEAGDVATGVCPIEGLIVSETAPGSRTTSYVYRMADDPSCAIGGSCAYRKGDLWKVVNPMGHSVEILAYDAADRVLSGIDANGVVTDVQYNARGWPSSVTVRGAVQAEDATASITYTPDGKVKRVTRPGGSYLQYGYDSARRLTSIEDNTGNRIEYAVDAGGNIYQEQVKDSAGTLRRSLSRVHNTLGQVVTEADAFDNPTDMTYDASGNLKTVTDALDKITSFDYDALNRVTSVVQDVGGIAATTQMQYDTLDRVTQVADPKGLNTSYTYNAFGELTQLVSPDAGTTTYTYNAAGDRQTATDARGVVATYSHDDLGRVTEVDYSGGNSEDVALTYDAASAVCAVGETFAVGRLSTMTDGSGSTDWCYDRRGNVVRKVQITAGATLQVRYGYTTADDLAWVIYPDGTRIDYGRNSLGQVNTVDVTRPGQSQQALVSAVTWHPFGPPAAISWAGGRTQQRPLNLAGEPQVVSDGSSDAVNVGFGFNMVGNLTSFAEPAGSTPDDVTFDYDALGRLTAFKDAPTGVAIEGYTYDATGNRTSFFNSAGNQAYTYASGSHWLTDVAGTARTYDAVGNTLTIGNRSFTYNAAGRMATTSLGGALQASYDYTGAGEQVRRVASSSTTLFLYDEAGQLLGQYDGTGAPLQQYVWLDTLPVGGIAGGQLLHVQPDALGTPRAVIDPARNVAIWAWPLAVEAFGSTAPAEDPDNDGTAFVFDLRFPGQRYDAASKLNQNYLRELEQGSGRYTQPDPIGLAGGNSMYSYVEGTPLMGVDPYGLRKWDFDGVGDTLVCKYYESLAEQTGSCYYKQAAKTCRGENLIVNEALKIGIRHAWLTNRTTSSQSEILNKIRNGLIREDRRYALRDSEGRVVREPYGNLIDQYHRKVFVEAGISPFFYGGALWPRGVFPNYVPQVGDGSESLVQALLGISSLGAARHNECSCDW